MYLENNYKKNISNFNIHHLDVFGFLILIICFFIFDKKTYHPSFLTLIPIFGCSLIILFSDFKKVFNKIFTFYPVQIIGLISFSLYVWHYPIFIFAKNTGIITGQIDLKVYLILFLFILSIFSYFIIEKPLRNKKLISNKFFLIFYILMFSLNFLFFNKISNVSKINSHHMLNKINLETDPNNKEISNLTYATKRMYK